MSEVQPPLDDEGLSRLLRARHAAPDPATLARALARVRDREAQPAVLAWLGHPAALAAAAALLVVSVGAGVWYGGASRPAGASTGVAATTDMLGSLLADDSGADTASPAGDTTEAR